MRKDTPSLLTVWRRALERQSPDALFPKAPRGSVLVWGKFAYATWKRLELELDPALPHLVIAPKEALPPSKDLRVVGGDHPLPRESSFRAGQRLVGFLASLDRYEAPSLDVYLSGGSSSLAWRRPAGMDEPTLVRKLEALYRAPLTIQELNRERARLCALKGGGAARLLRRFSPRVAHQTRVHLISDVSPFGPEVVGSGPFWEAGATRLPHLVVADQPAWVAALALELKAAGLGPIRETRASRLGDWMEWVEWATLRARDALKTGGSSILGGEPQVDLSCAPRGSLKRGGRQSQIAAELLLRFCEPISSGRLEILCGSTDGVDGRSGSSGAYLTAAVALRARKDLLALERAIRDLDTAPILSRFGALIPERPGGVNLQDALVISG